MDFLINNRYNSFHFIQLSQQPQQQHPKYNFIKDFVNL